MIDFEQLCQECGVGPEAKGLLILKTGEVIELTDVPTEDSLFYLDTETVPIQ